MQRRLKLNLIETAVLGAIQANGGISGADLLIVIKKVRTKQTMSKRYVNSVIYTLNRKLRPLRRLVRSKRGRGNSWYRIYDVENVREDHIFGS
jgi:hypothetical protein